MELKKVIVALILAISYLATSCANSGINIEGEIEGNNLNGETAYLYFFAEATDLDPIFLAETSINDDKISFEDLDKLDILQGRNLPTIALITLKDKYAQDIADSSGNPLASIILEQGNIKVVFKNTAVMISGTDKNDEFNKIQLTISNIANFAEESIKAGSVKLLPTDSEGRDGEAQYRYLIDTYKELNYSFVKSNMKNKVGEFLFHKHAERLFTPVQIKGLIDLGTETFQAIPEVKELARKLSQMKDQSNEEDNSFDISIEKLEPETANETALAQDSFDIVLEE